MNLIKELKIKNFRSFRGVTQVDMSQATYLIGVNNAGKTNIFHSLKAFFTDDYYSDSSFLNKTEFLAKKKGYNRSEIRLTFDLEALSTKTRKTRLLKKFGHELTVTKILTYTPISDAVGASWIIGGGKESDDLPEDVVWLLSAVEVTYIHPQEGKLLLANVQKKLRQRLLANWGRGAALTHAIKDLEQRWDEMRKSANEYLSRSISDSLQAFWPGSRVMIDLPRNIKQIIDVSDISFQGYKGAPEIELTAQGTGAQSTVLYLAHFLLDSDRSLHRGEYHPLWLMEEPESFLHMDLLLKLAGEINSETWLSNMQMVVSTHSPALLAASRRGGERVRWNILSEERLSSLLVTEASDQKVSEVGKLMGDVNFGAYFTIAKSDRLIFIEDQKDLTVEAFRKVGIDVTKGLEGIADVGRYLDLLKAAPQILGSAAYFIVDGDGGLDSIKRHTEDAGEGAERSGFKKLEVKDIPKVFLIVLPAGQAVEDLFAEYDGHLRNCVHQIWKADFSLKSSTPSYFSGIVSGARRKRITNQQEAIVFLRNHDEVKEVFWKEVEKNGYSFSPKNRKALQALLT
ncbi:MAG: AAA family ATPase [Patescibacteria group bacterium]|nr:AAA family ATPase [Patescibacteria group bacterium]